jgi:hypothetical protein
MMKPLIALSASALLLAACGGGNDADTAATADNTAGPAVSTSESPRNEAVDTTPTADATAQAAGANSYTEAQAKGAIESAGYTGVGALTQGSDGVWMGPATKDGAQVTASVDYKGAVTAQ